MNMKMQNDLKKLGVKEGGYLLVHSSYKALGPGVGDMEQVIGALRAAVGPEGTLLFPALSYESVNEDNPKFDIKNTPSCIGAIAEYFRKQPGVQRSMSPTHSVTAIGPRAKEITSGQENDDTPVGPTSPFRKLRDANGQILMLGCGLRPNTSMHGVEELVVPPYLFKGHVKYACTDWDGGVKEIAVRRHNFRSAQQRYDRIRHLMQIAEGKVLEASCFLIEAGPMWDAAEAVLRDDPLFFVDGY